MLIKKIALSLVAFATIFSLAPALAFAHSGTMDNKVGVMITQHNDNHNHNDNDSDRDQRVDKDREQQKSGLKVRDDNKHVAPYGVARGNITAITATGFTLTGKDNSIITVDASSAAVIKIPTQVIPLTDLAVGDYVSVLGTKTDSNVIATKVYMVSANIHKATAKGVVTAVDPNSVTIQTKQGDSVTFVTNTDTNIAYSSDLPAMMSDIVVGSKVKINGIWDSILNIFTAFGIRIR